MAGGVQIRGKSGRKETEMMRIDNSFDRVGCKGDFPVILTV
jgi:hypothetical protein